MSPSFHHHRNPLERILGEFVDYMCSNYHAWCPKSNGILVSPNILFGNGIKLLIPFTTIPQAHATQSKNMEHNEDEMPHSMELNIPVTASITLEAQLTVVRPENTKLVIMSHPFSWLGGSLEDQ